MNCRFLPVLSAFLPVLLGADWLQFRGPQGDGHVVGSIATTWGPGKNVVWKQEVPGTGWSSPLLLAGKLYLTTAVSEGGDQSLRVRCMDATRGSVVWDTEALREDGRSAPRIHSKNSHASPTPVSDGRRLYVHFGHQGTACLDLDGKVVWRNTTLGYKPVHGNGGSPILVGDRLIFSVDGADQQFVVALEAPSGRVAWKSDRKTTAVKTFSFSTPALIRVNGKDQVVSPGSDVVCSFDPRTGQELWRVRYPGYSVIPRPVFGHGLVYICTGYESPTLLAIKPDGKGDVTDTHVAWKVRRNVPHTASLLLGGDELYMVSDGGIASCLDARSGEVHWQERLGGGFSSSPVLAAGKVYFQNEDGVTTVVKAGRSYVVIARNDIKERTLASFAAADGALFLRAENHLYRIEEK